MAFKTFRKVASKAKKIVRKGARAYLKARRSKYVKPYSKSGMVSTTAVAKALSNLRARVNTVAEYKLLDQAHTTGSPDVALRQMFYVIASANQGVVGTTSAPPTGGYFLQQITHPTRGDGDGNFDGKRFHVSSIQWKGTLFQSQGEGITRLYIVAYDDEDMDAWQMYQFLQVDNNGEYSVASKRNLDFKKNYRVVASKSFRLSQGTNRRADFNIIAKPRKMIRHYQHDDTIISTRYFCVAIASSDLGLNTNRTEYQGNTRMRFIA
jgi:hypothetical protein